MFYKLLQRVFDGKIVKIFWFAGLLSNVIIDETGVNQGGPNSPNMFVDFL